MAQKVQIKFDIDNKDLDIVSGKVLTLQQQIKILKQEIQKPGYSPKELDILRSKLADTEDQFKATKTRSGDLITSLQLIPGPIGEIASKLNGTISLFKQFGSFNLSDLKFQFKETLNDIKDVGSAILKATGIQKLWTVATNALSTAFVRLGAAQTTAAVAARALAGAIAATGIGLLVIALSTAISKLMEYASNTKRAEKANDDFTASLQRMNQNLDDVIQNVKDQGEIRLLEAKKAGRGESELQKIREDNLKKEIKAIEEALGEKGKFREQEMNLVKDNNLTTEQLEQQTLELTKSRNAAARRLTTAKIELRKLELQGEIDANQREEELAEQKKTRGEKAAKDATELAAKQKKERDEQLAGIKALGQAALDAINKQKEEEEKRLQLRRDFNKKVRDLYNELYTDEKDRRRAALKAAEQDELEAFEKEAKAAGASAEEIGKIKYAIKEKYRNLYKQQRQEEVNDAIKSDEEERSKRLRLLELQGQGLVEGTRAYYQNRTEIINETEQAELAQLQTDYNNKKLTKEQFEQAETDLSAKYAKARKDIKQQELAAVGKMVSASIDALGGLTNALAGALDEEAKTSKSAFEKRKKLQVATAIMSAASGIVNILTQPSTLPSPADWIVKGINAAALIISTNTNIKKIKATEFEGGGGGEGSTPYKVTANRASGGIVTGPGTSTSDSIPAMISNGEYVVNARATSAFLPMLNAINDYGRRPRFAMGGLVEPQSPAQMLNENLTRAISDSMVRPVKTYVVGQDMSSQQQFDRLIKSRSMM